MENKGKIGVLIEEHFDPTEYVRFRDYFPTRGYQVDFMTHLWGNKEITFNDNDNKIQCTAKIEVNDVNPTDYKGILLIGAYAMDRLRYQVNVEPGKPNKSPAVELLRKCVATKGLKIGTICHSMWLFCADKLLLEGKKVTCAHNIICDVENAGADVQYEGNQTKEIVIDEDLISGKHPEIVDRFMEIFVEEIEKQNSKYRDREKSTS